MRYSDPRITQISRGRMAIYPILLIPMVAMICSSRNDDRAIHSYDSILTLRHHRILHHYSTSALMNSMGDPLPSTMARCLGIVAIKPLRPSIVSYFRNITVSGSLFLPRAVRCSLWTLHAVKPDGIFYNRVDVHSLYR